MCPGNLLRWRFSLQHFLKCRKCHFLKCRKCILLISLSPAFSTGLPGVSSPDSPCKGTSSLYLSLLMQIPSGVLFRLHLLPPSPSMAPSHALLWRAAVESCSQLQCLELCLGTIPMLQLHSVPGNLKHICGWTWLFSPASDSYVSTSLTPPLGCQYFRNPEQNFWFFPIHLLIPWSFPS